MTWLLEDPTPALVGGVVVMAILALALVKTGRGTLIWALVATAVLVALLLLVEWLVMTDRERVEDTLNRAAAALERNDVDGVVALFDPSAAEMRSLVAAQMGRYEITEAAYNGLKVEFNYYTNPPSATAEFLGRISVKDRKGELPRENLVHRFTVLFAKNGDRWLITGYNDPEMEIRGGTGKPRL